MSPWVLSCASAAAADDDDCDATSGSDDVEGFEFVLLDSNGDHEKA